MRVSRLAVGLVVSALIRRVEAAGGSGMVLARGDATAGVLLIQLAARGTAGDLIERTLDRTGGYRWATIGPADPGERGDYIARRRRVDPDLWVLELDHAAARAIVDDMTGESMPAP